MLKEEHRAWQPVDRSNPGVLQTTTRELVCRLKPYAVVEASYRYRHPPVGNGPSFRPGLEHWSPHSIITFAPTSVAPLTLFDPMRLWPVRACEHYHNAINIGVVPLLGRQGGIRYDTVVC